MSIITENNHVIPLINQDEIYLEELLIKNLPTKIRAGRNKAIVTGRKYPSYWGVQNCDFIEYNSPTSVSITVLDFDWVTKTTYGKYGEKGVTVKEKCPSIHHFYKYFLSEYLEPNFIVETPKGYQAFIIWNSHITKNYWKSWNLLQHIKKGFINQIPFIDSVATARNKGVFRNPLKHKSLILNLLPLSLYDFKDEFAYQDPIKEIEVDTKSILTPIKERKSTEKEVKTHQEVKSYVKKVLLDEFIEIPQGFREITLFQLAVIRARNIALKDFDIFLLNYLYLINNKHCVIPLDKSQLISILNIVKKYKVENKLTVQNPLTSGEWTAKPRTEINKDYYQKNKDKNTMTNAENLNKTRTAISETNRKKVLKAVTGSLSSQYKKKNGQWNVSKMSKELNMSRITITKYLPKVKIT